MKKMILGAVIATASLFTGCKLSAADDLTSCDVKSTFIIDTHQCVESTDADAITRFCSEQRSKLVTGSAITSASACPGGAKKTCNGKYGTYYLYDDFSTVKSCDNYN